MTGESGTVPDSPVILVLCLWQSVAFDGGDVAVIGVYAVEVEGGCGLAVISEYEHDVVLEYISSGSRVVA